MNCQQARPLLADFGAGDIPEAAQAALAAHVRDCPACSAVLGELEGVRRLLDAVPPPPAGRVDLPALYRRAAELQRGQARRWRRLALAVTAAAALLLAFLALRVELRWQEHQLIIGWGSPAPPPPAMERQLPPQVVADLEVLRDLVHAIAAEQRSQVRWTDLQRLEERLDKFAAASRRDLTATQNAVRALHTAYFDIRSKGDTP